MFNANTDWFYSRLRKHLLKQVDDLYIQATSMDDLDRKLRVAAKEAIQYGCTWSISKFFAARPCNIVSGFRVVLDTSGLNYVVQNLTKLEYLQPLKQVNTLHAMTDASINSLGFILFQKDSEGKFSIIQVGSTCL